MMKKLMLAWMAGATLALAGTAAHAIVIDGGPDWPGSADISGSTNNGVDPSDGANIWTYPNAGNSAVANLYFGLAEDIWSIWGYSADFDQTVTAGEQFQWYADYGTTIEYRGQTVLPSTTGNQSLVTRLLITGLAGATIVSDSVTQALGNDVHSLLQITGTSFQVERRVEVSNDGGSSWTAADVYYNSQGTFCGGCSVTNFGTGFYWEDLAAAPAPGSLALLALGLLGLGWRRHSA